MSGTKTPLTGSLIKRRACLGYTNHFFALAGEEGEEGGTHG